MSDQKWDAGRLDRGARSMLKRNAGCMMGSNLHALEAFYSALTIRPRNREQEEQWFACLCMECLWKAENGPRRVRMEELLRRMYQSSESSESIKHRIIALMDEPWNEDGYLLGKLCNFARILNARDGTVMPDFEALADDLNRWNFPEKNIQRRWIRTICGINKEEIEETEEEKNVD